MGGRKNHKGERGQEGSEHRGMSSREMSNPNEGFRKKFEKLGEINNQIEDLLTDALAEFRGNYNEKNARHVEMFTDLSGLEDERTKTLSEIEALESTSHSLDFRELKNETTFQEKKLRDLKRRVMEALERHRDTIEALTHMRGSGETDEVLSVRPELWPVPEPEKTDKDAETATQKKEQNDSIEKLKEKFNVIKNQLNGTINRWIRINNIANQAKEEKYPRADDLIEALEEIKPRREGNTTLLEKKIDKLSRMFSREPSEQEVTESLIPQITEGIEDVSAGLDEWHEAMDRVASEFPRIFASVEPEPEKTPKDAEKTPRKQEQNRTPQAGSDDAPSSGSELGSTLPEGPEVKKPKSSIEELRGRLRTVTDQFHETNSRWRRINDRAKQAKEENHPQARNLVRELGTIKPKKEDGMTLLERKITNVPVIIFQELHRREGAESLIPQITEEIEDISAGLSEWNEAMDRVVSDFEEIFNESEQAEPKESLVPAPISIPVPESAEHEPKKILDQEFEETLRSLEEAALKTEEDQIFEKSFRYIINEAKLSSIIFAENKAKGEAEEESDYEADIIKANTEAEKQLQYLNEEKIKNDLGVEIKNIISAVISGEGLDHSEVENISEKTGLSKEEVIQLFDSAQQEIRNMAVAEAHKKRNWKKIIGGSAARILAYSGAGAISAVAGFGWGGAAGIAGVRVLDRTITELLDKKKVKAKEKELRGALQNNATGKEHLYDNFVSGLAKKQQERINGHKFYFHNNFLVEPIVEKYSETEEQKEALMESLEALYTIDRCNKEWIEEHGPDAIEIMIKSVGESRVGKALDVLAGGGKSTSEKVVASTMLGVIGLIGRQAPGVRNVLIGIAGWRAGDLASKIMDLDTERQNQKIEQIEKTVQEDTDQINSSKGILEQLRRIEEDYLPNRRAKRTHRKAKLVVKAGAAAVFFVGSFIIPELLGYNDAKAEGVRTEHPETTHTPNTSENSNIPTTASRAPETATPQDESGIDQETLDKIRHSPAVTGHSPNSTGVSDTEENHDITEPDEDADTPTATHHHTASMSPSRDQVANSGSGTHATPETGTTPDQTPELERQIELGTVHKGGSVWRSVNNQFRDLETAKKFGFNPSEDGNINHWAEIQTNKVLRDAGYIRENGEEVRVGTSGIGKTAYVLETDSKGDISVREYFDGKPVELHGSNSEFETTVENYEYGYSKEGAEHQPEPATAGETSAPDQAPVDAVETINEPPSPLSAEEISKLEVPTGMNLDSYALYPIDHISDDRLEALNQELGGRFKLFEVDTNNDGKVDHVFTFFENRIVNQDALDYQDVETSLRINELRLDNQIESSLQRLCGDSMSREQLISLIKAGNEVGISGFSPTEGAIPGSSFEQFLNYFKGHHNLFITEENKISTDQMKIFASLNGNIDQAHIENILSRTHNLLWNLDRKLALAQAMTTPNNPEITPSLLGKDLASPTANLRWSNAHTLKFEGLAGGRGKLIIDFNDTLRGIRIPEGFLRSKRHFALNELQEAIDYLKAQQ